MSPSSFESLQVYFSKFKALVLQLKQCGIDKKDEKLVLAILLNLGHDYLVFFLTFHATKLTAQTWRVPSLPYFMEYLIHEQDKLVMMGTIKPSKDQDLVVGDSKVDSKGKKKDKNPPYKKRDKSKSHEESSNSKRKNSQKKKGKGEMSKCAYCGKGFHPESSFMKKHIDMLTKILENNNISLPSGAIKKEGVSSFEYQERVHALVASTSRSSTFIIDSRASRHMVSTRGTFSSLDDSKGLKIVLGDDSVTNSMGKGRIDLDDGSFNDVLYVLDLIANLL